tara:strand:- start:60 stop:305 length:246 start_codon:yes stop_codon:yes gene_type:complete
MAFEKLNINLKATPVLQELIQDLENKLECTKSVLCDVGEFADPSFINSLEKDVKLLEQVLARVVAQQELIDLRQCQLIGLN